MTEVLHRYHDNSTLTRTTIQELLKIPIWKGNRILDTHHSDTIYNMIHNRSLNIQSLDSGYRVIVYKEEDASGKMKVKSGLSNHCWKLWHANVITWDGLVVPCCFDKDATHQLGNLKTQSFKEVWKNDNYKQFRYELSTSRKNIDICANCSEGMNVWED